MQVNRWRGDPARTGAHPPGEVLSVQTASALAAGCTSATLTNGLDVVKTRLQVRGCHACAHLHHFAPLLSSSLFQLASRVHACHPD